MAIPAYPPNILAMAIGMEPKDAVEFFEKKGWEITWSWKEVLDDANNKVFQVAKSMNMEILQTIRNEVDQAIKDGVPFEKFRKNLEPKLQAQGWWGKKKIVGPRGIEEVQLGSPHRLETIYRTNVQSSYNAGRWQGQVENKKRRPYLMLVEVIDKSTRDSHREMSGSIAPVDSPFWQGPNSWYPPNGFNALAFGTNISILNGERPIQDIKIGDLVKTHTNSFKKVYDTMKKIEHTDLFLVEFSNGKSLKLTGDHPVLTKRGWLYTEDLTENDEVLQVKHICQTCKKPLNLRQQRFCSLGCLGAFNKINRTVHRFCEYCGKEIENKGKKKNFHYCSQACLGEGQRKNKNECLTCGKIILGNKKAGLCISKDRKFCSRACFVRFRGETSLEKTVRTWLESNNFDLIQEAKVGKYRADFLLPIQSVIIEVDSEYWHSQRKDKDNLRDEILSKDFGLFTIRITEKEIKSMDFSKLEILKDACSLKNQKDIACKIFRACI